MSSNGVGKGIASPNQKVANLRMCPVNVDLSFDSDVFQFPNNQHGIAEEDASDLEDGQKGENEELFFR